MLIERVLVSMIVFYRRHFQRVLLLADIVLGALLVSGFGSHVVSAASPFLRHPLHHRSLHPGVVRVGDYPVAEAVGNFDGGARSTIWLSSTALTTR
jgi:hypothetical protein